MRMPGFTAELSLMNKELPLKNEEYWLHLNAQALRGQHRAEVVPQLYMCGEDHVLYECFQWGNRPWGVFHCYSAEASC
jgi:hypothetical protein